MMAILVIATDRLVAQPAPAKKVVTHADYDNWKTASAADVVLSRDGKYLVYSVSPIEGPGDVEVIVRHLGNGKEIRIARGGRPANANSAVGPPGGFAFRSGPTGRPQFNPSVTKLVIPVSPTRAELEKAKADKVKAEDTPQSGLAVMDLPGGKITRIPRVSSFTVGGEGAGLLVYELQPKVAAKSETPTGKSEPAQPPKGGKGGKGKGTFPGKGGTPGTAPPTPTRTYGTDLVIRDLATDRERTIPDVSSYLLTKDSKLLVFTVASRKGDTNGVYAIDPTSLAGPMTIKAGPGRYTRLTWDEKQTKLAFFHDGAAAPEAKDAPPPRPVGSSSGNTTVTPPARLHVYVWDRVAMPATIGTRLPVALAGPGSGLSSVVGVGVAATAQIGSPAIEVAGPNSPGLRTGWVIANSAPRFNADGSRVYLQTAPERPRTTTPTTPAADRVELDIWHWKDERLQSMQKVQAGADLSKSYAAVALLDSKQFRQLSDESISVSIPLVGDWGLGDDDRKYRHLTGYVMPVPGDYSFVNVKTGERQLALTGFRGSAALTPNGKFLLAFDGKNWQSVSVPDGRKVNLTAKLPVKFFNEDDDHPDKPPPYGSEGVTVDGKFVVLSDRYDIWKVALDGSSAENLTKIGRSQQVRFRIINIRQDDDDDARGIDLSKPLLLAAENLHTRDTGFYRLAPGGEPKMLVMGARRYGIPQKAKNADTYLLTVQSFYDYPDYFVAGPDFHELKRVTDINPTIRQYNWGRTELVRYKSADGLPLSGVLIKPENFDPSKKYPMVVYIYERLTNTMHQFRIPTAGTSINPTFYASNGYLVFMPDIAYTVGYPGQSALKCVLPAIQAVVDKGFVDEKGIGIQGHSWGGYQIADMVTQTNRFKAAIAGAPVSNMISAYDGIRWSSGLPRQFQYELSQSRIGGTPWTAPMRFIENSPIFLADRVQTPLLMLHNDQDGAVPWYQGIEYYLALRRLGKECYMLNYNGEDHGLRKRANQQDYTVRMYQFFEHHLKGKPAPQWMAKGVPYIDRDAEKEGIKKEFAPQKQ